MIMTQVFDGKSPSPGPSFEANKGDILTLSFACNNSNAKPGQSRGSRHPHLFERIEPSQQTVLDNTID